MFPEPGRAVTHRICGMMRHTYRELQRDENTPFTEVREIRDGVLRMFHVLNAMNSREKKTEEKRQDQDSQEKKQKRRILEIKVQIFIKIFII